MSNLPDKPEEVLVLTDDNFDEALGKYGAGLVVDFWAAWCMPCKMIAPSVEALAKEDNGMVFGKVNVDENPNTAGKYGIMSIPTLLVFKGGEVAGDIVGAQPKPSIESTAKQILGL